MTNELVIYSIIFIMGIIISIITTYFLCKNKNNNNELYLILNDFKKTIDENKNQNTINTLEVKEAIKDARTLTKILTTNQNLKGQYGENCLENILKVCYPNNNIDYVKQYETLNSDDKKIKPDFLVKLPNEKSILIDCKLNLEKYIEYKEENNPSLIKEKKLEFIKDLNSTINSLSNKKYETAKDLIQADFILMYIPLEPILTLVYTDNDFISVIKNANDKNIIIVGNSSILTTIKLVKLLWNKDSQEKNMQNIIQTAQNIYNLIALHSKNLYEFKEAINKNTENFNKEYEKLAKDNKLFKYTEQLKDYGITGLNRKEGRKLNEISINSDFLK